VRGAAAAIERGSHPLHVDGDDRAVARIDPGRLAELVGHLVENAVKFSPPEAPIAVGVATSSESVVIEVRDDGPGIPPERRDEAFGRFVRFRPAGYEDVPGAGLGLHISRGLAAAHGGTISVADTPSGGTMLRVSIPRADGSDHDDSTTKPETGHEPGEVAP
jgi:signal transduction histidine kinase